MEDMNYLIIGSKTMQAASIIYLIGREETGIPMQLINQTAKICMTACRTRTVLSRHVKDPTEKTLQIQSHQIQECSDMTKLLHIRTNALEFLAS